MNLEINYKTAYQAHAGTSFSPEKRAIQEQNGFKAHIEEMKGYFLSIAKTEDQKAKAEELSDLYASKYHKKYIDYLHCRSGLMSSMITGPARFPVDRMNKKNQTLHNKSEDISSFTESKKRKYARIIRNLKPEGWSELEETRQLLKDHEQYHETVKAFNILVRKKLSEEEIKEQLKKQGHSIELLIKLYKWDIDFKETLFHTTLTYNRTKIKNLKFKLSELERQENATEEDNQETIFEGGTIVQNQVENRLQILFDDIPSAEIRTELKSNGFRWSRKFSAWQRQLTNNAIFAVRRLSFVGSN